VSNGGLEVVEAGASASGSVIDTGGQLYVAAGGTASGTTLTGGIDTVVGTAIGTTVNADGVDYVAGGGLVSGATLNNGAIQVIYAGGTALGDHANSGSLEYVTSGGIASSAIISGGTMEIESGGSIGAGPITFATSGGGTLRLDDSVHFGGLIAGFGLPDQLDLTDIAFISGTTTSSWTQLTSGANASGTLTISDGTSGTTASITLLGTYTSGNFHVTSDGLGGTLVLDPPVGGQSSARSTPPAGANGTGTGDVTLLGQLIAGTSTSNGGPSLPQGNGLDTSQVAQVDYSPLVVTRHT
jgi:autotransporter passenger strand-loop-strand repeat protein